MAVGKYSETDSFLSRWGSALGLPEMGISELFKGDTRAAKLAASNAYTRSKAPGSGYVLGALVPNSDPLGQGQALYNAGKAQASGNTGGVSVAGPERPVTVTKPDLSTPNMGDTSGNGEAASAAAAKAQALDAAKARYMERYGVNKQANEYFNQFALDAMDTAGKRAQEQKGILGSQYGKQREQMTTAVGQTQNALSGAYSSRGLGDSSFAQKAKAQADLEFNNNLSMLNENEAAQYKEIDNYLSDLAKQREYKLKEISLNDYNTEAEYDDAVANLDAQIKEINAQQASLRNSLSTTVGKITGSTAIDNTMKFQEVLNSIMDVATLPVNQKKTIISGILQKAGNKTPDDAADYWMNVYDTTKAIAGGTMSQDAANKESEERYGEKLF